VQKDSSFAKSTVISIIIFLTDDAPHCFRHLILTAEGQFIVMSFPNLRKVFSGTAQELVYSTTTTKFAIRETATVVKVFFDSPDGNPNETITPAFRISNIFGGKCCFNKTNNRAVIGQAKAK